MGTKRRERERTLHDRIAQRQAAEGSKRRATAAQYIRDHYAPSHPRVYAGSLQYEEICPDFTPGTNLVELSAETFPGLFVFPLLSESFCSKIWEEIEQYLKAAQQDSSLPLSIRHDGNIGD